MGRLKITLEKSLRFFRFSSSHAHPIVLIILNFPPFSNKRATGDEVGVP